MAENRRSILVTGGGTGIGAAVAAQLRSQGHRVITTGLDNADVVADLSTASGRRQMVEEGLELTDGELDAYVANAGVSRNSGDEKLIMAVNFFGAFEPLLALRETLARSRAPAVVMVSSWGMLRDWTNDEALEAALAMDEPRALAAIASDPAAEGPPHLRPAYATSKAAMGRMARRLCWKPEWAGAGITINVVAPAVTRTPMTEVEFAMPGGGERLLKAAPSPLGRIATPEEIADMVCFFAEGRGRFISGQVIFADGGLDARRRPETPIQPLPSEDWI